MLRTPVPQKIRVALRIASAVGFVPLLLLLTPATSSAALFAEPDLVGAGVPFRLVLTGTADFFEPPGGFDPSVEVAGDQIFIHLPVVGLGLADPPGVFAFAVNMPPLPLGLYDVKVQASGGDVTRVVGEHSLFVGDSYVSSVRPEFAVAGRPFELTVAGLAPAPGSDELPYIDDGLIVVPLSLDLSAVSPPPPSTPFEFVVELPGLPAGTHAVVVGPQIFPFQFPYFTGQLDVVPDPLTLQGGRFHVTVDWVDTSQRTGKGLPAIQPSDDSALFWFFGPDNWELMLKVLDACDLNGHYWVLGAASTDVGYTVEIQGPQGTTWTHSNPVGQLSEAFADAWAFDCTADDELVAPPPPADLLAAEGFHSVTIEPRLAVPGLPIRAVAYGHSLCCSRPALRRIETLGRTIRIHLQFSADGFFPSGDYGVSADLGVLEEGTWELQVIGHGLGEPGERVELTRHTIDVVASVGVRVVPERPLSDESVRLFVQGLGTCPSLELEAVDEGRIRAHWSPGGCLSPPEIAELDLDLGGLAAGTYEVEVRSLDEPPLLLGGTTLTVHEAPVSLGHDRFTLDVVWRDFTGRRGRGRLVRAPSADSALFWFFGPDNWELMVKVLDGCEITSHHWVLGAASTTVEYDLTVTDRESGTQWTFHNDLGATSPAFADAFAFPCSGVSP